MWPFLLISEEFKIFKKFTFKMPKNKREQSIPLYVRVVLPTLNIEIN